MFISTFSIVAYEPSTGYLGVGTASRALAAGGKVITLVPGICAVASQSWASQVVGRRVADLIGEGLSPGKALKKALSEDTAVPQHGKERGSAYRQIAVIDAQGRAATHTGEVTLGPDCVYAGSLKGKGYAVAGNMLAGKSVIKRMAEIFEKSDTGKHLALRIFETLNAGEAEGGDRRGRQSAAIMTAPPPGAHPDKFFDVDLRVDDHEEPLEELERILSKVI